MRTFSIETLGCKVNQYESEQIATLLRRHGLRQASSWRTADLRVINTCSVTVQAASKSRQTVRRQSLASLPVLGQKADHPSEETAAISLANPPGDNTTKPKVVVVGCWATSDAAQAAKLPGVSAVIGHQDDIADRLPRLVEQWILEADACGTPPPPPANELATDLPAGAISDEGWINAFAAAGQLSSLSKPSDAQAVKQKLASLPLLESRHAGHQRAFLKIQDGCDAHCTYCIIPQLRPTLGSKPIEDAVEEARRLVGCGHVEIVLTGIFMGAYGQPTALRRRQPDVDGPAPLARLIDALCERVPGLKRLRLSSLEPGDLTADLLGALRSHRQVVPHFHLPLQSGSDRLLRRMNRQYTRDDFFRMIDRVNTAFDRPAITTDIIVGFPGETAEEFDRTLEVVDRARFVHIHAFSFSPRPGTAAARWTGDFVRGPVVNERIELLNERARHHSYVFRRQFIGETVEVLVEIEKEQNVHLTSRHGRCERYFQVNFKSTDARAGDEVRVVIDEVTEKLTLGRPVR